MFQFLESLDALHQAFWYVALGSSAVFLIQALFTFIGGGDTDGLEADFDGGLDDVDAPFQFFSFRNLVNFLLGFGWTGVAFYEQLSSKVLVVVIATVVGLVFIMLFWLLIKQILKLTEDNTFRIEKLIGKTGEVYILIPAAKSGKGKIMISLNGTSHELSAITLSEVEIKTNTPVKVTAVDGDLLIVEPI